MAELYWTPLRNGLASYLRSVGRSADADLLCPAGKVLGDAQHARRIVNECGHVVAAYFDARTINYFATVAKELFQCVGPPNICARTNPSSRV